MDATICDDRTKLRRYIAERAAFTGRSEFLVLLEFRGLLDLVAPDLADHPAARGWRRLRAAVAAEYDRCFGLRAG